MIVAKAETTSKMLTQKLLSIIFLHFSLQQTKEIHIILPKYQTYFPKLYRVIHIPDVPIKKTFMARL